MVKIGNIRTFVPDGSIAIKVDRTSPLGNPFHMDNESKRDEVCNMYRIYFYKQCNRFNKPDFIRELNRIVELAKTNDITLLCWCYPKRCHAETIKKYIDYILLQEVSE